MVTAHGNYYHWILETVSRLAWADHHGLIGTRRVLVPEGARPWMQQALALAGIGPDRQRAYAMADDLHLVDACVLSSVDFSSRSLLTAIRERFWQAAGVAPPTASPGGRWLFLSRPGNDDREVLNLDVEQMAREAGFEVVFPETLDIAGQVRLFASAAGLAGLEGAAFTNQVFAPDGIRVLGLGREEDNEPSFINMAVLLNQPRRCLAGRTPPRLLQAGQYAGSYHLAPEQVRVCLDWVRAGACAPSARA
jgi:capsular polysaccharide biosynthesis protein